MKIGVKTFDSEKFLKHFENDVDFFEVMALQKNDYSFLKQFSLPFVIHAEHQFYETNPADISKKDFNLKSVNFARKIADMTNAEKIIVHPGHINNKYCSIENAINFFREINDERILIENLPGRESQNRLCTSVERIENFIPRTGMGFCFDINHVRELKNFNGDYNFIKEYITFNPRHYHLGGQKLSKPNDHLCLEETELDMKKLLSYYPDDAEITLETEPDIYKTEKDVKIIRNVLGELRLHKYL